MPTRAEPKAPKGELLSSVAVMATTGTPIEGHARHLIVTDRQRKRVQVFNVASETDGQPPNFRPAPVGLEEIERPESFRSSGAPGGRSNYRPRGGPARRLGARRSDNRHRRHQTPTLQDHDRLGRRRRLGSSESPGSGDGVLTLPDHDRLPPGNRLVPATRAEREDSSGLEGVAKSRPASLRPQPQRRSRQNLHLCSFAPAGRRRCVATSF